MKCWNSSGSCGIICLIISFTVTESSTSNSHLSLNRSDVSDQIVALSAGRGAGRTGRTLLDRYSLMSCLASMFSGPEGLRWTSTVNLPNWLPGNLDRQVRPSSGNHVCPLSPTMLLVLPQEQDLLMAENVATACSLCHPALRGQTLRRLSGSGGLQPLIDRQGDSSLGELEAFIDSYFEMVWEHTMGSPQAKSDRLTTERDPAVEQAGEEDVLSSIDRKLSKLELLEEIRKNLAELRESLEHSWKVVQELRETGTQDANKTC